VALRYSRIITGEQELPDFQERNDFFVNWQHIQDPKLNPSIRFSANVNAGSSTYNTFNANRPNDYLTNIFQSNVAWAKTWKFGMLSSNLRHTQNTSTRNVNLLLPQVTFTVNRFYPLVNPNKPATTWFRKLAAKTGASYTADFQNNLDIGDSSLQWQYRDYVASKLRNGLRQTLPVSTSMSLLNYLTLTPSATINSVTQFKTIRKSWIMGGINNDSGYVRVDTINGVRANFDWNVSASVSTRFFGMFFLNRSKFSVIRHTVTPTVSFTFMPDFTKPKYGFYETVQTSEFGGSSKYSIFEGGIFGASVPGNTGTVGFNLLNSFEGKTRVGPNDTDQTEKRISLIDALNFGISYNILAKHYKWSMLNAGMRTKLFRLFDINASIVADPYRADSEGRRIERFEWRTYKRIARLTGANLAIGTSLRKGGLTTQGNYDAPSGTSQELNMINSNPNAYVDFNIPWSLNASYNLGWTKAGADHLINQNLRLSGDMNVTPKWKIGFDSNYDFEKGQFGYSSLNIYRDLHCWELQFNWIPFGIRQSYSLTLNVKSAVLQDLRLSRKRDWYDFSAQ
ncbi:MAG TPA: putative LPS assembly protein LptD, partial [Bacteroidia bacterium]|nr:putative LPS assembly protein LptD [Bacteroidia bacterium]